MAMHEALQGVTKVRLSRYCIFIEGSKLESRAFHYFNDYFILAKYWTRFSKPRAEGVSRSISKKRTTNKIVQGVLKKEANLDSTYRNVFR